MQCDTLKESTKNVLDANIKAVIGRGSGVPTKGTMSWTEFLSRTAKLDQVHHMRGKHVRFRHGRHRHHRHHHVHRGPSKASDDFRWRASFSVQTLLSSQYDDYCSTNVTSLSNTKPIWVYNISALAKVVPNPELWKYVPGGITYFTPPLDSSLQNLPPLVQPVGIGPNTSITNEITSGVGSQIAPISALAVDSNGQNWMYNSLGFSNAKWTTYPYTTSGGSVQSLWGASLYYDDFAGAATACRTEVTLQCVCSTYQLGEGAEKVARFTHLKTSDEIATGFAMDWGYADVDTGSTSQDLAYTGFKSFGNPTGNSNIQLIYEWPYTQATDTGIVTSAVTSSWILDYWDSARTVPNNSTLRAIGKAWVPKVIDSFYLLDADPRHEYLPENQLNISNMMIVTDNQNASNSRIAQFPISTYLTELQDSNFLLPFKDTVKVKQDHYIRMNDIDPSKEMKMKFHLGRQTFGQLPKSAAEEVFIDSQGANILQTKDVAVDNWRQVEPYHYLAVQFYITGQTQQLAISSSIITQPTLITLNWLVHIFY